MTSVVHRLWWKAFFTFLAVVVFVASASAGPVILGGDDLTDHGSISATPPFTLINGWLYIQKALENIAPQVTRPGNDGSVAVLGSADSAVESGDAGAAYHFAVPNAAATTSLSGVVNFFNGVDAINQFFADLSAGNENPAIIVTAGTGASNDLTSSEGTALTNNALAIANFVNSGGGLLSHGFRTAAYGWLTALIPEASFPFGCDRTTLSLTLAGQLAFPGLTNSDIRSGPCHNHFLNHGLPVLARDAVGATPGPGSDVTVPETEPNDSSGTANLIAIGDDYTGAIDPGNESDFVSFSGAVGQTIVATTVLGTQPDSTLRLLDVDGVTELAFNDDFGGLPASQIVFTLPVTGTYFLEVRSLFEFPGTYTLELREGIIGREIIIGGGDVTLPVQIALTPDVDFNAPGTDHTVTANVVDLEGSPLQNKSVTFEVLSGPNIGTMGIGTTNLNGDVSFTYTSNGGVGLDTIQASFVDATQNTVVNRARKYWDLDCQANGIPDTCDLDCAAFNATCAVDFPGCGGSVDTEGDGAPDECINNPPVAQCQNVEVLADRSCQAGANVESGSFDPDGDPITLSQSPANPYPLGDTVVTVTVTENTPSAQSDRCNATVTVVDNTRPAASCIESVNPSGKKVPRAKKVNEDGFYRVSASDNCSVAGSDLTITIGGISLYNGETIKITQRPGKSGARLVNTMGPLDIKHFQVGPGDAVVTATDGSGNAESVTCLVPPPKR